MARLPKIAGFRFKIGINGDFNWSWSHVKFGATQDAATIKLTRILDADHDELYKLMRRGEPVEIIVRPENMDRKPAGVDVVCRMAKPIVYDVTGICAWKNCPILEEAHFEFLEFTSEDWEIVFAAKRPN
jgi:hypothetical protein